jgi:diguanylate cyclase
MLPAQIAKAALRRLLEAKLEPTPENYGLAYRQEAGGAAVAAPALSDTSGEQWADLIDRIVRGIERRSRQWTSARKKDSLQRVLGGSRGDAGRLQQRLRQLVAGWDGEGADADGGDAPAETMPAELHTEPAPAVATPPLLPWSRVIAPLGGTLQVALSATDTSTRQLADAIALATRRLHDEGPQPAVAGELEALCGRADRVLQHRHHLIEQLGALCTELTTSLTDLAEDDSWARGQCDAMRVAIEDGLTARSVKSVSELLHVTRERQVQLRAERERAREALKSLINQMLSELDELGSQTGRFHESVGRYADVIEKADSLEGLAGVVREMVEESRTVQALVAQTQQRLNDERGKASDLSQRVSDLETELRRLSEEVSTDQLTQIANRRGLIQAFEAERSRMQRSGSSLCVGLLDIDNFKRLNDDLGHAAGDEALKALAALVSRTLRPSDVAARYGGEEFVVLLPDTPLDEGQQILTRLQRSLTGGLFMHEHKQVFVTFSAGVTAYREGERLEGALERADQALYEAKRTGKNRTCVA